MLRQKLTSVVGAGLLAATLGMAEAQDKPGVYIIYDSSNSMWGALPDSSRKYEAARAAMRDLAGQDFGERDVALRMYGHRRKDDCSDSELVVPFRSANEAVPLIVDAMERVRPTGRTPIDRSLRDALQDFGGRSGSIILVSDGIESCDADPCALVRAWRDREISIQVHVVGLGLRGKERAAMQCIADAAGTEYRDAFSTTELTDTIGTVIATEISDDATAKDDVMTSDTTATEGAATADGDGEEMAAGEEGDPLQPGTPNPNPEQAPPDFALIVETGDGVRQRGAGVLVDNAGAEMLVESFQRYTPEPGEYTLTAGLQVVGGEIYMPVTTDVTVADAGRTTARVVAPIPPQVSARFAMEGEALRATVVTVYRDGKKLGSFKGDETAFVPEGTLEFRSQLTGTSEPTIVNETFVAGDSKEISFDADIEVHLLILATASANGERMRGKPAPELRQNGEVIHTVNNSSGGLVTPGTYQLVIDDGLNRFETEITVTRNPDQEMAISIPTGSIKIEYQDAGGAVEDQKRVFFSRLEGGRRVVRQSGEPIALVPGRYAVQGWPKASGYPNTEIEIDSGDAQTLTLRATN